MGPRIWQVDAVRGAAVVLMIVYHLIWDLAFLDLVQIDPSSGFPLVLAVVTASLFLSLVGVSMAISQGRRSGATRWQRLRPVLWRSAYLFTIGLGITSLTFLLFPDRFVIFGVLQCIAVSSLLAFPLVFRPRLALLMAVVMIAAGVVLEGLSADTPWLLWAGLRPEGLATLDYFPLLPWTGTVFLGMALGNMLVERMGPAPVAERPRMPFLSFLGRHSLPIYIIHQPILLAALYLLIPMAA